MILWQWSPAPTSTDWAIMGNVCRETSLANSYVTRQSVIGFSSTQELGRISNLVRDQPRMFVLYFEWKIQKEAIILP